MDTWDTKKPNKPGPKTCQCGPEPDNLPLDTLFPRHRYQRRPSRSAGVAWPDQRPYRRDYDHLTARQRIDGVNVAGAGAELLEAADIDYCLADPTANPPVAGFPVQVQDVADAVRALSKPGFDGGRVNVDPSRVAVWGGSAGATLAAETGVTLGSTGATPVAAMVGWSGGYDFLDFRDSNAQAEKDAQAFLGCDPQTDKSAICQSQAREGSAALKVTATTPPMSLWNSSDELVPITQWQDMKKALTAAHIPSSPHELIGHLHSNAYTHQAFCPTVTFLTSYLGPYTGTCVAPPNPSGTGAG